MLDSRPSRMPEIEAIADNNITVNLLMMGSPYAGDEENPRPMPKVSLADYKKGLSLNSGMLEETWHARQACYFTFASDSYSWAVEDAITVPAEHLWWLAARSDTVLISDRMTHHYTGILDKDMNSGSIKFIDGWPERFFLLPGMNAMGIEASRDLTIAKDDFLKVIVGSVTLDTPDILESYLENFPEQRFNPDLLWRMGLMLLDDGRETLAIDAAPLISRALSLLRGDNSTVIPVTEVAARLYLSLKISIYQNMKYPLAIKPMCDELECLLEDFSEVELRRQLDAHDCGRIAYSAGLAQQFEEAMLFFDDAIQRDSQHEYNYYLRACVFYNLEEYNSAIEDLNRSLALNAINREQRSTQLAQRDKRDHGGISRDRSRLDLLQKRLIDSLLVLSRCHIAIQQFTEAEQACMQVLQEDIKHIEALNLLILIKQNQGDRVAQLKYLRLAQLYDPDAKRSPMYQALISALQKEEINPA